MPPVAVLILLSTATAATNDARRQPATPWTVIDRGLQSGNFERRRETIVALSTIPGSNADAVRRLEKVLREDKDGRVRQQAAWALGQMKAKSAIPALRAALDDHGEVAFTAAKSLIDLGDPSGRDMLVAVLAGKRSVSPGMMTNMVREAQSRIKHPEGLILMGAQDAAGAMFAPAGMGLTALEQTASLKSKGSPARAAAAAYLAKDPDPKALNLLEWALQDDSKNVRMEAAKALGERGNRESIAKLEPLLSDSHNAVRVMAAAAILRLRAGAAKSAPTTQARLTH